MVRRGYYSDLPNSTSSLGSFTQITWYWRLKTRQITDRNMIIIIMPFYCVRLPEFCFEYGTLHSFMHSSFMFLNVLLYLVNLRHPSTNNSPSNCLKCDRNHKKLNISILASTRLFALDTGVRRNCFTRQHFLWNKINCEIYL